LSGAKKQLTEEEMIESIIKRSKESDSQRKKRENEIFLEWYNKPTYVKLKTEIFDKLITICKQEPQRPLYSSEFFNMFKGEHSQRNIADVFNHLSAMGILDKINAADKKQNSKFHWYRLAVDGSEYKIRKMLQVIFDSKKQGD
jgi:hypothetical protein